MLTAFLRRGMRCWRSAPGLGKNGAGENAGGGGRVEFSRVQFTPDLMPADIIRTNLIIEDEHGKKSFSSSRGRCFANIFAGG